MGEFQSYEFLAIDRPLTSTEQETVSRLSRRVEWEFRQLLASRRIPAHYDESEVDHDIATLREIGRL